MVKLAYLESKRLVERDIIKDRILVSISTIGISVLSIKS